jgi:hypothetical protein
MAFSFDQGATEVMEALCAFKSVVFIFSFLAKI